jgi:hypothetical protein
MLTPPFLERALLDGCHGIKHKLEDIIQFLIEKINTRRVLLNQRYNTEKPQNLTHKVSNLFIAVALYLDPLYEEAIHEHGYSQHRKKNAYRENLVNDSNNGFCNRKNLCRVSTDYINNREIRIPRIRASQKPIMSQQHRRCIQSGP